MSASFAVSEYTQYVPQPDLILDSTTGQFFNPSEFLDSNGNLVPPEGFDFITGVVLQNAMPFPQIPQLVSSGSMGSVQMIPYTNVPQFYYPTSTLPYNFGYSANTSPMMQPIQAQPQILPQQIYQPNYQTHTQDVSSLEISRSFNYQNQSQLNQNPSPKKNLRKSAKTFQPTNQNYEPVLEQNNALQKDVKTNPKGFGEKQKVIPRIYDYVENYFAKKNKFVTQRTIDGVGTTFRVCAKSIESLVGLPRLLLHLDNEISMIEVSLHVMVRKQTYKKGVTCYIKIENKEDINRTLDICDLYGQKMVIVSKGDKDTRDTGLELQIMYRKSSTPEELALQKIDIDGHEDILMPRRSMKKAKSSILTVVFPETGHVVNLNIEGLEDDNESDSEGEDLGLIAGRLDKQSSLTLQQVLFESLNSAEKNKQNINSSDEEEAKINPEVLTQNVTEN